MVGERKLDPAKAPIVWTTPEYADYNWTVRCDLDEPVRNKIAEAFLALDPKDPDDKAILDLQRASGYVRAKPEMFEGIERAARSAGLLK
jgi:phosphonate transport system substrate-binding protein